MNANVTIDQQSARNINQDMLETHLISGTFQSWDAREQAIKLILDLQNHYSLRAFSHLERFGTKDLNAERTLKNLNETLSELRALFDSNDGGDIEFRLLASISVAPTRRNATKAKALA